MRVHRGRFSRSGPGRRRPRARGQDPSLRAFEESVVEAGVDLEVTEQKDKGPVLQLGVTVEDAPGMHGKRPDLLVVEPRRPKRLRPADAGPHARLQLELDEDDAAGLRIDRVGEMVARTADAGLEGGLEDLHGLAAERHRSLVGENDAWILQLER